MNQKSLNHNKLYVCVGLNCYPAMIILLLYALFLQLCRMKSLTFLIGSVVLWSGTGYIVSYECTMKLVILGECLRYQTGPDIMRASVGESRDSDPDELCIGGSSLWVTVFCVMMTCLVAVNTLNMGTMLSTFSNIDERLFPESAKSQFVDGNSNLVMTKPPDEARVYFRFHYIMYPVIRSDYDLIYCYFAPFNKLCRATRHTVILPDILCMLLPCSNVSDFCFFDSCRGVFWVDFVMSAHYLAAICDYFCRVMNNIPLIILTVKRACGTSHLISYFLTYNEWRCYCTIRITSVCGIMLTQCLYVVTDMVSPLYFSHDVPCSCTTYAGGSRNLRSLSIPASTVRLTYDVYMSQLHDDVTYLSPERSASSTHKLSSAALRVEMLLYYIARVDMDLFSPRLKACVYVIRSRYHDLVYYKVKGDYGYAHLKHYDLQYWVFPDVYASLSVHDIQICVLKPIETWKERE